MSFSINGIPIVENIGTVGLYSGATDPSGWVICDGQPRTNTTGTYNNLYLQTTGKNYGYNPLWTNYGISSTISTASGSITLNDVRSVAVSNVGTVVLADRASTGLYISQNNGSTYSAISSASLPTISFSCVDVSQDGTKIVAAANVVGQGLFLSTNTGSTWTQLYTQNGLPTDLVSMDNGSNKIAISNDGTKIAVAYTNGFLYFSSNSGSTFQKKNSPDQTGNGDYGAYLPKNYWGLGMSKDGTKLVTAVNNGTFVVDINKLTFKSLGGDYVAPGVNFSYTAVAISVTGQFMLLDGHYQPLFLSSNYGASFVSIDDSRFYGQPSISGDGKYITHTEDNSAIKISSTYGANWFFNSSCNSAQAAVSYTGQYILGGLKNSTAVLSSDYGVNFKSIPSTSNIGRSNVSNSGKYMIINGDSVYISTSYGINWRTITGSYSTCISASGKYASYSPGTTTCYISNDYLNTFNLLTLPFSGSITSISYTGQFMLASNYLSSSYGKNWVLLAKPVSCMSSDANYFLGQGYGSYLWLGSMPTPVYWAPGQNNVTKYWTKGPGGLTTGAFSTVNTSYTGQYIIAAITSGAAYLSNNYGQSWTTNPGSGLPATAAYYWSSISTTGQYIGLAGSNFLYLSSNFGANWILNPGSVSTGQLECIAMSGTGQYMLLSAHGQSSPLFLYMSSNFGNSWTNLTTHPQLSAATSIINFYHPAVSQSGQYISIATRGDNNNVRISSDYGITWGGGITTTGWAYGNVMSGNGQYMYSWRSSIIGSSDFGKTWPRSIAYNGAASESVTGPTYSISYTGQYVIITTDVGYIYSSDYGNNWATSIGLGLPTTAGTSCAISSNGNYMLYCTGSVMYMSTYKDQPLIQQQNQVGQSSTINPGGLSGSGWQQVGVSQNGQYVFIANTTSGSSVISSTYGASFRQISAVGAVYVCSMSYNGQFILTSGTTGNPYLSTNYGLNWRTLTVVPSGQYVWAAGISGNGQYIASATRSSALYLSSNYGVDFVSNPGSGLPATNYYDGIAISYTGQYMYTSGYKTSNFGNNWTSSSSNAVVGNSISTSASGQYVLLCNPITSVLSTNYGVNFYQISADASYMSSCMSWNGKYMLYGNHFSNDYGKSFTTLAGAGNGCGMSANANYMYYFGTSLYVSTPQNIDGGIAYSTDSGNNWINGGGLSGPYANSVAISGDGSTMLANYYNDATYVSTSSLNDFSFVQQVPISITSGLALSSTGQYGIVTQQSGGIYTTTNYGSNFTAGTNGAAISDSFAGAASVSASGSVMVSGAGGVVYGTTTATNSGAIAFSTGSGLTINNPAITNIDIRGLATSNTGTILYADRYQNGLFLSVNSGISWSQPSGLPSIPFSCVDISQDGTQMLASANVVGYGLYVSSTSGASWRQLYTQNGLPTDLIANDFGSNKIAISNDGTKISVAYTNGFTYFSSNSGASFQNVSPQSNTGTSLLGLQVAKNYWGLGMSKDGSKLVTAVNNGSYIPNINNIVWTQTPGTGLPASAAFWNTSFSYSGQYVLVNVSSGAIYVSSNYGNNFFTVSSTPTTGSYLGGAVSATGQYMYSGIYLGSAYISTSYGQFWSTNPGGLTTPYSYASGAISATGQYFIIGNRDSGKPYFSSNFGTNFNKLTSLVDADYYGAAISATGQYIMVSGTSYTQISSSYGVNWTSNPTGASGGFFVSMSGTGQYMLIAKESSNYNILISSNYGSSFSTTGQTTPAYWTATYVSYTGQFMMAVPGNGTAGTLRMSSSYGANWSANPGSGLPGTGQYRTIGMSANAQYMIAGGNTGSIWLASNPYWTNTSTVATFNTTNWIQNQGAGQIWTKNPGGLPASKYYYTQSISHTGQYVLIVQLSDTSIPLHISTNYGRTFTPLTPPWGANTNYGFGFTAISSSGQYSLATASTALGILYMSTNYCVSYFAALTGASGGRYVAISGSGQFMIYINVVNNTYISTNYGTNWSTNYGNNLPQSLYTVSISYTGQYMIGNNTTTNVLWKSTNYGLNWSQTSMNANSQYVTVSYTGQYMTYGQSPGTSYISSDYGNTFNATPYRTYMISMSASAQYMTIAEYQAAQTFYLSTNYGKNWTAKLSGLQALVHSVISGNGDYIYACGVASNDIDGYVYQSVAQNVDGGISYSTDSGNNWASILSGPNHNSVAISADGSTMLAGYQNNSPYLSVGSSNTFNPLPIYPAVPPVSAANAIPYSNNYGMSLSDTGQYGIITQSNGQIYYTSNTGSTWQTSSATTADNFYGGAYISGNGQYITASAGPNLYTSLNNGSSFTKTAQIPQPSGITYITYSGSSSTSQNWNDAAISSNGQYMLAASNGSGGGFLYLSTNSGAYWSAPLGTSVAYQLAWNGCAVSPTTNASGYYVMAATVNGQSVYLSVNSGTTWTSISSLANAAWSAISMDADGATIAVIASGSQIYVSTNTGSTWQAYGSALAYSDITVSLTGQYMAATVSGGQIYVSTSFGTTWTPYGSVQAWSDVYMSSGANIMIASVSNGPLYISTNTGQAWVNVSASVTTNSVLPSSANWANIGISSDATQLVATISGGSIYTSTNGGSFWSNVQTTVTGSSATTAWSNCLAMSGNGSTILAGQSNIGGSGLLYVSINTLFTKTINTATWSVNNVPATIAVQSGTITLTDVRGIATSDVGTVVLADRAGTGLFISQNNGTTFATVSGLPSISFSCVDISSDGTKIVAASNVVGYGLYVSNNSGSTWSQLYTQNGLPTDLVSMDNGSNKVAISNDGTKISVAYTNGLVYYSSNSGATFKSISPISTAPGSTTAIPKNYWGLGMSKDGSKLVTAVNNGSLAPNFSNLSSLFVTTPGSGLSGTASYGHASISYNGQYQAIGVYGGGVYVSANYGSTWTYTSGFCTGGGVGYSITAMSATGQYIYGMVGTTTGTFCYSSNYGVNWINTATSLGGYGCRQISCSATGQFVLAPIDANSSQPCLLSSTYGTSFYNISTSSVPGNRYGGGAVSSTGQYMVISGSPGNYSSSNYGINWTGSTGAYGSGRAYISGSGQYSFNLGWIGSASLAVSSTYGTSFYSVSPVVGSPSDNYGGISYTGQYMVYQGAYSSNYGVNWTAISNMVYPCISANGQYVLTISATNGSVKLANFPYYANGQNYITKSWSLISGNGLPASTTYQYMQYSYTGQYVLIATNNQGPLLSTNYGNSWLSTSTGISWPTGASNNVYQVGVSSNGQYMSAVTTKAFLSTNYGYSWTQHPGGLSAATTWQETSISGNGQYVLFMTSSNSVIWLSSNFGSNFYQLTNMPSITLQQNGPYEQVCISNTGQYIFVPTGVWPYLSTSYGEFWTANPGTLTGNSQMFGPAAMSSSGQYILVMQQGGSGNGNWWVSSNYGANWKATSGTNASNNYSLSSVSSTGQYMIISNYNTGISTIYWSANYGITWTTNPGGLANLAYTTSFISPNAQYAIVGVSGALYGSTYNGSSYWLSQNNSQFSNNFVTNPGSGLSGTGTYFNIVSSYTGQYILITGGAGSNYLSSNFGNNWSALGKNDYYWRSAISFTGQYILLGSGSGTANPGSLWVSSDFGSTWTYPASTPASTYYWGIAISQTGQYMFTGGWNPAATYLSTNYGVNWTQNPGNFSSISTGDNCKGAAISGSGQYIVFGQDGQGILLSTNYGQFWKLNPGSYTASNFGYTLTMSFSGKYIIAGSQNINQVYLSSDFGNSWVIPAGLPTTAGRCLKISISFNEQMLIISYETAAIYFSTNSGQSFYQPFTISGAVNANFISGNAQYYGYATYGGAFYLSSTPNVDGGISYSTDSGNNWKGSVVNANASSVAISGDGSTVISNFYGDFPYVSVGSSNQFYANPTIPLGISYGTALSSTGQNAIITQQGGKILTTTNYGSNFTNALVSGQTISDQFYGAASISQNGLVANAAASGIVYTSSTVNTAGQVAFSTGSGYTYNANNQNFSTQFGTSYNTYGSQSITTQAWLGVSISSNGQLMAATSSNSAGGYVFISTNTGSYWSAATTLSSSQLNFSSVSVSASTGQYILASVASGNLYVSANTGTSWTTISSVPVQPWIATAVSSNGQVMVAVGTSIQPYVSTNYGVTWTSYGTAQNYSSVATSSTGQYMAATTTGGQIYLSTNTGTNWAVLSNSTTANWTDISISSTGQYIIASANNLALYLSNNFGLTWRSLNNNIGASGLPWSSVNISSDGLRIVATTNTGYIYTSINSGTTWTISTTTADTARPWQSIAISGDGSKALAITNPGQVYTSTDGQVLTFTPITMPTTTTLDGTTLRYITKI